MTGPVAGATATLTFVVGDHDTAQALGSGDVPVLATPRLVAWAEAATVAAVADNLAAGVTTVGIRVEWDHMAASPVGAPVEVTAEVVDVGAREVSFDVTAREHGRVVGRGVVRRAVVDRDQFLSRIHR